MTIFFSNGSRIDIFDACTRIVMPDGFEIMGAPEDTDSYRATAANSGYGDDTVQLCKDHELMHLALAEWLGCESPTLRELANGTNDQMRLRGLEEDAILCIQKYARAMNVNLIALLSSRRS